MRRAKRHSSIGCRCVGPWHLQPVLPVTGVHGRLFRHSAPSCSKRGKSLSCKTSPSPESATRQWEARVAGVLTKAGLE